ncbi:MAG: DUF402 domain-containing protein [Acholeplasmataceae bacterium]
MKLKSGKKIKIHSYKHDGSLHRVWMTSFVVEDTLEFLATGNQNTKVIESNGRYWHTKEPAICYFFEKEWFNIIAMLKKDGIHFYCNIASPYLYDGEALKYIDYDLDIRVYPDGNIVILDEKDYEIHSDNMDYPDDLQEIINKSLIKLENWIKDKRPPFDLKTVSYHYDTFKTIYDNNRRKTNKIRKRNL